MLKIIYLGICSIWDQNANNLLCQRTKVEVKEYGNFLRIYRDSRDWTHVISAPLSFSHWGCVLWSPPYWHTLWQTKAVDTCVILGTLKQKWTSTEICIVYGYSEISWTFFGIALLWEWNEKWHFPVLWSLPSFPNLLTYWVQLFNSIIF